MYHYTPEHTELNSQNKSLKELTTMNQKQLDFLQDLQASMIESAKIEQKRFIFQTIISIFSLIASVIAAVAALISLF